jgi:hypothetical protein
MTLRTVLAAINGNFDDNAAREVFELLYLVITVRLKPVLALYLIKLALRWGRKESAMALSLCARYKRARCRIEAPAVPISEPTLMLHDTNTIPQCKYKAVD